MISPIHGFYKAGFDWDIGFMKGFLVDPYERKIGAILLSGKSNDILEHLITARSIVTSRLKAGYDKNLLPD